MDSGVLSRCKGKRCDTDLSFPSSAQVKNEWSYIFTPLYAFMAGTKKIILSF
jgi:hypothetical protein